MNAWKMHLSMCSSCARLFWVRDHGCIAGTITAMHQHASRFQNRSQPTRWRTRAESCAVQPAHSARRTQTGLTSSARIFPQRCRRRSSRSHRTGHLHRELSLIFCVPISASISAGRRISASVPHACWSCAPGPLPTVQSLATNLPAEPAGASPP